MFKFDDIPVILNYGFCKCISLNPFFELPLNIEEYIINQSISQSDFYGHQMTHVTAIAIHAGIEIKAYILQMKLLRLFRNIQLFIIQSIIQIFEYIEGNINVIVSPVQRLIQFTAMPFISFSASHFYIEKG